MAVLIVAFSFLALLPAVQPLHIGHSLQDQQNWHKLSKDYEKCAFGFYQTPIRIEQHNVEDIIMPALEFSGYHNFLRPPLTLYNNGHTVKVTLGFYDEESLFPPPQISGGLLTSSYILESFHFHWGEDNEKGSEHILNNARYPMEMHLVHRNLKYSNISEALLHKDGIAVLGFFFHVRVADNNRLRPIVNKLRIVAEHNTATVLDRTFSMATILPNDLDEFFTYEGSLTTPPCSESVTWFIFPETIPISFRQIDIFRTLPIHNNYRMTHPVGQRKIYYRRNDRFITPLFETYSRRNVSERSFWLH